MANERLELTFTGLCVMVIKGPVGTVNPSLVELRLVDDSMHQPRISFRGLDLGDVSTGRNDPVNIRVAPDGQEIIDMPIPARAAVVIKWDSGAQDTQNVMSWDASDISMLKTPDLFDFNVKEIHRDGTNTAAVVSLPLGHYEARRIVKGRGAPLLWTFDNVHTQVFANQVALLSEAAVGAELLVNVGGRVFRFLSGDGTSPLQIGITNLPAVEKMIEPGIGVGGVPSHLAMYKKIAKVEIGGGFRTFFRTGGETRQGSICPVVRAHV